MIDQLKMRLKTFLAMILDRWIGISILSCILRIFSESVEKKCGYDGHWEEKNGTSMNGTSMNGTSIIGWANYTTCLTPEMLRLHSAVYNNIVDGEVSFIKNNAFDAI